MTSKKQARKTPRTTRKKNSTRRKNKEAENASKRQLRKQEEEEEEEEEQQQQKEEETIDEEEERVEGSEEDQEESDEDYEQKDDINDEDFDITTPSRKKRRKSTKLTSKKSKTPKTSKTAATPSRKSSAIKTGKGKSTPSRKAATKKTGGKKAEEESPFVEREIPGSLFSLVRKGEASFSQVVNEWIERYKTNHMMAVSELVSFVIQSSGSRYEFNATKLKEEDLAKTVEECASGFPDNMPDYPIISTHTSIKGFNSRFIEFWDVLIHACQEEILYEDDFMDNLLTWIIALSSSKYRAFRHTSCLALYTIMDILIDVCQSVKKTLAKVEKQLDNAKKKKSKSDQIKVQELNDQCSELQGRIITLDGYMSTIFEGVFAHRFRDTVPNIRALTLVSVGGWIINYPSKFLNNNTLKYLGWGLNDEIASIRSSVLVSLSNLFDREAFHAKLEPFAKKFIPRIVEMAISDVDIPTCVEAIKLLTILLRHKILGNKPEEHDQIIKQVSRLLFDENRSIRHYAGIFVFHSLARMVASKNKSRSSKKSKKLDVDLEELLEFMREYCEEIPLVAYYVVENFWNLTDCVKDWQRIVELLTDKEDELPAEEDTLNLIRLLTAAVQKVNEHLLLKTTAMDNVKIPKSGGKKTKKEQEDAKKEEVAEMTGIIAAALPQLLDKYQAEPEKLQELTQIPQHLNLEAFTEHHLQSDFDEILKLLRDIFWKYSDPIILRHIAQAFNYLLSQQYSLKNRAQTAFDEIVREMITKLQEAVSSLVKPDKRVSAKDKSFNVLVALQRIREFTLVMDVDLGNLYNELSKILDLKISGEAIDNHSTQIILSILWQKIIWLKKKIDSATEVNNAEVESLLEKRDKFVQQLIMLLDMASEEAENFDLALASFYHLCDLFIFFAPNVPKDALDSKMRAYERLAINLSRSQIDSVITFFDQVMNRKVENEQDEAAVKRLNILKQRAVVALGNAVCNSTASEKFCPVILSHFASHGHEVEEAVKYFAHELKKADESTLWDHEFESMKRKFTEYLQASKDSDEAAELFTQFANLVSRLALQHFWGKDTKHIALVVRMSLQYIFDNVAERHAFFGPLAKYAVKLSKEDAKEILSLLDGHIESSRLKDMSQESISSVEEFKQVLTNVSEGNKSLAAGKDSKGAKSKREEAPSPEAAKTPVVSRSSVVKRRRKSATSTSKEAVQEEASNDESQGSEHEEESDTHGVKRKRLSDEEEEDNDETQISNTSEIEDEDIIPPTPAKKHKL
jgi:cohesin complex subunit SA-1/2